MGSEAAVGRKIDENVLTFLFFLFSLLLFLAIVAVFPSLPVRFPMMIA